MLVLLFVIYVADVLIQQGKFMWVVKRRRRRRMRRRNRNRTRNLVARKLKKWVYVRRRRN